MTSFCYFVFVAVVVSELSPDVAREMLFDTSVISLWCCSFDQSAISILLADRAIRRDKHKGDMG
jgi:hypothetical protein